MILLKEKGNRTLITARVTSLKGVILTFCIPFSIRF